MTLPAHCRLLGVLLPTLGALLFGTVVRGRVIVSDVDATAFPEISARLYTIGADGLPIPELAPDSVSVSEGGFERPVSLVSCPVGEPTPVSVAVMIDAYRYHDLVGAGLRRLVDDLRLPPSEIGITINEGRVFIRQAMTMDPARAIEASRDIRMSPGAHLQKIFYDDHAGGVGFVSGRLPRKALVLITDLHCPAFDLDTLRLWSDADRENIRVYSVLLNANDDVGIFERIADRTGGRTFENVSSAEEIESILGIIAAELQYEPCMLRWRSDYSCNLARSATVRVGGMSTTVSYGASATVMKQLGVEPVTLSFGPIAPGEIGSDRLTIRAINAPVTITSFSATTPGLTIVDPPPLPLTLQPGESRELDVRFVIDDSSYHLERIRIESDACGTPVVYASAGMPGWRTGGSELRLVSPNGGEQLVPGSEFELRWEGCLPGDVVELDYSLDAGLTWSPIARDATGLSHRWSVPATPSRTCLARVRIREDRRPQITLQTPGEVHTIRFAPNDSLVVTGGYGGNHLWDAVSGRLIDTVQRSQTPSFVGIFDVSIDSKRIVSASNDVDVVLWDVPTRREVTRFRTQHYPFYSVLFSPRGDLLLYHSYGRPVTVVNTASLATVATLPGAMRSATFSPDGSRIATHDLSAAIRVWNALDGRPLVDLVGHVSEYGSTAAWSPDGERIVSASYDGTVRLWNATTGAEIHRLEPGVLPRRAIFSPDGLLILVAGQDGVTRVYDADSGALRYSVPGYTSWEGGNYVTDRTFSPSAPIFATVAYKENWIRIWDATTGREIAQFEQDTNAYVAVFSADGTRLATGGEENTVRIWDIRRIGGGVDVSDSLWAIVAPESLLAVDAVDMGQVTIGRQRDSLVVAVLCNPSGQPLGIAGVEVTGGDADEFMIMSGGGDFVLEPGECRDIVFTFAPLQVGMRMSTARIILESDTLDEEIALHGVGVERMIAVRAGVVDFGPVVVGASRDSLVVGSIRNVGADPLRFSRLEMIGPDTAQFSLVGDTGAFELAPGESRDVVIRFAPMRSGRTSGRLAFHYGGAGSPATMAVFGEGIAAEVATTRDSIDFGRILCSNHADRAVALHNFGTAPLAVTAAAVEGAEPSFVSIVWSAGEPPFVIAPGEHAEVQVRYDPLLPGRLDAELRVSTDAINRAGGVVAIPLRGWKDSLGARLARTVVRFDTLEAGTAAQDTLWIVNTGTLPIEWRVPTPSQGFSIASIVPAVVAPDDSAQVVVRFEGGDSGTVASTLLAFDQGDCSRTLEVMAYASVKGSASARIVAPTLRAIVGDTVSIRIALADLRFASVAGVRSVSGALRFDASLLFPVGATATGEIRGAYRRVPFEIPVGESGVDLRFRALLGRDTSTTLELERLQGNGGPISLSGIPGRFALDGVCVIDGAVRRIAMNHGLTLKVSPNPSSSDLTILLELPEDGPTRLFITDLNGERVAMLLDAQMSHGTHVVAVSPDEFTLGTHFVTLETRTERRTVALQRW